LLVPNVNKYYLTARHIAGALTKIGGMEVNAHLSRLLSDEQLTESIRGGIADAIGDLGERSVVPELVRLLSNEKRLDADVRRAISSTVGVLAEDEETTYTLAKYLKTSDYSGSYLQCLMECESSCRGQDFHQLWT
jgi:hypothetical protein